MARIALTADFGVGHGFSLNQKRGFSWGGAYLRRKRKSPGRETGGSVDHRRKISLTALSLRLIKAPSYPHLGAVQCPEHYSRRQLLAKAAIAASRVGS